MNKKNAFYLIAISLIFIGAIGAAESPKKLKILVATYTFPKLSETFVLSQVIGLLERGHEVYVHSKRPDLRKVHENVNKYDLLNRVYYDELPKDIADYDALVCQFGPLGIEFLEHKEKLNLKAKLITIFRGFDMSLSIKDNEHYYDKLFEQGDYFMAASEFFKQRCIDLGCSPHKIEFCSCAIDCDLFSYCERDFTKGNPIRIISPGRFVPKKGIDDSICAVAKALQKYPNIELVIPGLGEFPDTSYQTYLEELVKELGIQNHVTFTGPYVSSELAQLLASSHIFLAPCATGPDGNQEGIPNTPMEAMATGLPVISTIHAGIPELISHGVNGLLVAEHDTDALCENICYLIEHPDVCARLGKEARKTIVEKFEFKKVNTEFANRIEAIASH